MEMSINILRSVPQDEQVTDSPAVNAVNLNCGSQCITIVAACHLPRFWLIKGIERQTFECRRNLSSWGLYSLGTSEESLGQNFVKTSS